MHQSIHPLLLALLCFGSMSLCAQRQIPYGSNNGKYVSVHNTKIYYEEYGKGTPLLLLQGGMGGIEDFALCIDELSKRFRVIAPDTPGQGRSAMADSMSYQMMAIYVSTFIDVLRLDSAYIMGWSDGGITALILADMRRDKVKKVIASGANYQLSGMIIDDPDWLKPMPASFEIENKDWVDRYHKMSPSPRNLRKVIGDLQHMWGQEIYFPASVLTRIKIPVMVVQGDKDSIKLEHSIEMHRLIKGSQLCVLPNTSHRVFFEKPNLMNELAISFFGDRGNTH